MARFRPAAPDPKSVRRAPLRPRPRRLTFTQRFGQAVTRRGVGSVLAIGVFASTAAFGFARGGQYDAFVAQSGRPLDLLARIAGFGLDTIVIAGQRELTNDEIVAIAGLSNKNSLLFLDPQAVREKLKSQPLIKDASVRKLFPDRLVIDIVERDPFALWQKDGEVALIAADGKAIDRMRDQRFARLPFVVGEGANQRVEEYLRILTAAGDLRGKVVAGMLVGQRRWNIKFANGLELKLPEVAPEAAMTAFVEAALAGKLLDKDVIAIDMRTPGKMHLRLSEEAAAARADAAKKTTGRGGPA